MASASLPLRRTQVGEQPQTYAHRRRRGIPRTGHRLSFAGGRRFLSDNLAADRRSLADVRLGLSGGESLGLPD